MSCSELSDGQSGSGGTVVVHGSLDSFPRHSVGHNPMFGEAPDAQVRTHWLILHVRCLYKICNHGRQEYLAE